MSDSRDGGDRLFSMFEDYLNAGFARRDLPEARQGDAETARFPAGDGQSKEGQSKEGHSGGARPGAEGHSGGAGATGARRATGTRAGAGTPEQRRAELDELAATIRECTKCPLSAVRTNAVPGYGVLDADVFVIGEGPGAEEDRRGEPFVGRSGNYLDKWLAAIDIYRDRNAFIGNIVKCRPPQNRDPLPEERTACFPYLERQIEIVRPRTILTVGRISSRVMTGVDASMGDLRKGEHQFRGIPVVATYHPSAVLRNDNLRRPVWEDLKRLLALIRGEG